MSQDNEIRRWIAKRLYRTVRNDWLTSICLNPLFKCGSLPHAGFGRYHSKTEVGSGGLNSTSVFS